MSLVVLGPVVGLLFGAGASLVATATLPGRPGLASRVLPYVPEVAARLGVSGTRAGSRSVAILGGNGGSPRDGLARRLARAGRAASVAEYRVERLRWGAVGLALATVGWLAAGLDPLRDGDLLLLCLGSGFVLGAGTCEIRLVRSARARQRRMADELATVAEQIAWALVAGLPLDVAVDRVVTRGHGTLVDQLARVCRLRADGVRLSAALRRVGHGPVPPPVERYLDSLGIALERGAPVTDVALDRAVALQATRRDRAHPGWAVVTAVAGVAAFSSVLALGSAGALG